MLSTSFTMSGEPKMRPPRSDNNPCFMGGRKTPTTQRPPSHAMGERSLTSVSAWSPTYNDCDKVIQDIYAMTTTARTRRRDVQPRIVRPTTRITSVPREGEKKGSGEGRIYLPGNQDRVSMLASRQYSPRATNSESIETRMANLRISEPVKYPTNYHGTTSPAFDTKPNQGPRARPNISSIQSRPLPPPGSGGAYRPLENIYQSPVRPAQDNRDFTSPRARQNQEQKPTTRHSCDFSPSKSKLPLPRHYLHQPVPRPKEEISKSKAPGLGKRAATELEFSRPGVSSHPLNDLRVPPGGASDHPVVDHGDSLVKKGLMWVQQDKMFSRWKERFIILTTGYLQIFKKGTSRISDMGTFVSKIRLSDVDSVTLEDRRGYLTLVITSLREVKLLLRKTEGIKEWQQSVEQYCQREKQQRRMQSTNDFWNRKQFSDSHGFQDWLSARDKIGHKYGYVNPSPRSSLAGETPLLFDRREKDCKAIPPSSYFLPSSYSAISNEDDSGFESLVTITSDSSSNSSRIPLPISSPPSKSPDMFHPKSFSPTTEIQLQQLQPRFAQPERKQYQADRKQFHLSQLHMHR